MAGNSTLDGVYIKKLLNEDPHVEYPTQRIDTFDGPDKTNGVNSAIPRKPLDSNSPLVKPKQTKSEITKPRQGYFRWFLSVFTRYDHLYHCYRAIANLH